MPKETYIKLLTKYTQDEDIITNMWQQIELHYSDKKRNYHTLSHLKNVLQQLLEVQDKIENWATILFSLFYHDVVYNPLSVDNEAQSAEYAKKTMQQIMVPNQIIETCTNCIMATQAHFENPSLDINYFIDADLSILGQKPEIYKDYSEGIRNEFLYYPSVIYNDERIKILEHFVRQESIYKTRYFKNKFEKQARVNIMQEIKSLKINKKELYLPYSNQWSFNIEEDGDWYEFFQNGTELLDKSEEVEKIKFNAGFFDSGNYQFYFKKVKLNLEYEATLGITLKTESSPKAEELLVAKEAYELLKNVRNKHFA